MQLNHVAPALSFAMAKRPAFGTTQDAELTRIQQRWDDNAQVWGQVTQQGLDAFRNEMLDPAVLAMIGPLDGQTVLDAGCADGFFTHKLATLNPAKVIGVDISPKLIAAAQQRHSPPGGFTYQVGSITDLKSIPDSSVDQLVCTMTLMDTPNLESVLKAFNRVLKPNGQLVFSIKHPMTTLKGINYGINEQGRLAMSFDTGYFDTAAFEKRVEFEAPQGQPRPSIQTIHYPRTFSTYITALKQAGFLMTQAEEPYPTDAQCQVRPYLRPFQRIPFALVVKAQKVGPPGAPIRLQPVQFGRKLENVTLTDFQRQHFVYGGTLDPYHLGHELLVTAARTQFQIKPEEQGTKASLKISIIPAADPPHKSRNNMATHAQRVEMPRRAHQGELDVEVLDIEANLPTPSYTVNTMRAWIPGFDTLYQRGERAVMLIGEDTLDTLHLWREAEVMAKNTLFVVAPRTGTKKPTQPPPANAPDFDWIPLNLKPWNISSSEIRKLIAEKAPWHVLIKYLPAPVLKYIQTELMYTESDDALPAA